VLRCEDGADRGKELRDRDAPEAVRHKDKT
jgi:hypothetical protein